MAVNPKISCEEARILASRNLDGDLGRQEVSDLFLHISDCSDCRSDAAEMAFVESAAQELSRLYSNSELGPRFAADLKKSVPSDKGNSRQDISLFRPLTGILARPSFAALTGALASLLLFFFLFPATHAPQGSTRFSVHPIAFHSAEDTLQWHHRRELPPGESARMLVRVGSEKAYHFKLEAGQEISELEIVHEAAQSDGSNHRLTFRGARYATLAFPAPGDVLVARNMGRSTVVLKAHTRHAENVTLTRSGFSPVQRFFSELLAVNRYSRGRQEPCY